MITCTYTGNDKREKALRRDFKAHLLKNQVLLVGQKKMLDLDQSKSISFWMYGNTMGRGKGHIQLDDGRVVCGAEGWVMDGRPDRVEFDGKITVWHYNESMDPGYFPKLMDIEEIVTCKKCRAWLKKNYG